MIPEADGIYRVNSGKGVFIMMITEVGDGIVTGVIVETTEGVELPSGRVIGVYHEGDVVSVRISEASFRPVR